MKKTLLILFFACYSVISYSQTNNTTNTNFSNGLGATKFLNTPYGLTPNPTGILPGSLYYFTSVNKHAYWDGTAWRYYLPEAVAALLYKPLNAVTAWVDISGKPTFFSGMYADLINKPDLTQFYSTSNPAGYISSFQESDPIWTSVMNNYRTKVQNDALYQAAGAYLTVETDPTVSSFVKSITAANFANGNTAYSWGDHALAGYITQAVADNRYPLLSGSYVNPTWIASIPYTKITGTPTIPTNNNQLTNGAGYITTETDPLWTAQKVNYSTTTQANALYKPIGYAPDLSAYSTTTQANALYDPFMAPGTTAQYMRGDKTWQTLNTTVVPEGTNLYSTNSRVLNYVLTGYVAGTNAILAATDTFLSAFQKIQGQINALIASIALKAPIDSPTFTGTPAGPTATAGTSTNQLASTLFVANAVATALPTLVEVSTTTQALVVNRTYIIHTSTLCTMTLPSTNPPIGSLITFIGDGGGMYKIAQNAGQYIVSGGATSTVGVTGYVQTNAPNTNITLRYISNNKFSVTSSSSTPTIF